MLTQQRLCRIYDKYRLEVCKSFPIDQRDIDEVALSGGTCGYRFEKHPSRYPPSHLIEAHLQKPTKELQVEPPATFS